MLSDHTLLALGRWSTVGQIFGASVVGFDPATSSFFVHTDPHLIRGFKWTYQGLLIWMGLSFTTLLKFYFSGEMDKYKISLVLWLCGIMSTAIFSIFYWLPEESCSAGNMTIQLLSQIQGNKIRLRTRYNVT